LWRSDALGQARHLRQDMFDDKGPSYSARGGPSRAVFVLSSSACVVYPEELKWGYRYK